MSMTHAPSTSAVAAPMQKVTKSVARKSPTMRRVLGLLPAVPIKNPLPNTDGPFFQRGAEWKRQGRAHKWWEKGKMPKNYDKRLTLRLCCSTVANKLAQR